MSNVSVRGLVKRYGSVAAVAGIDLEIAEGELVVLLGPSGCGKTTTLRCIAGLEEVSEGEIAIGGRVVSTPRVSIPPEKRAIGMVFQSYALWPHMTVAENVAFGLKFKHLAAQALSARVDKVLELVGLSGFARRSVSQLSGGQQQRVALARAVVLEPRVLLFDEPLSNMDARLRERMRFELRHLQKRLGITSIYVTHDQQEAMVLADRIVLMNQGRIDQIGTSREVYARPASSFGAEFIGLANMLPGQVLASGATTRVRLADAIELESADAGFSVGQAVDVVCRPENLKVSTSPLEGGNTFRAKVSHTYFLGNVSDVYLQAGRLQLRAQLSPPEMFEEGQDLWTQVAPKSLLLFPRKDN